MPAPLRGRLVLDFTTLLPGPLATLMLAEAGAEVVKIERPSGEELRFYEPQWGGTSAAFALLNRGKASLALDLKSPAAMEALRPLLERADILVEQFRPGVMARLGLGYEALAAINPRLIYCSITGYGQSGPKASNVGHDLNYLAESGLLAQSCGTPERPALPPAQIADIGGGTYPAVINILLALIEREATGRGCHLDIAMVDGCFAFAAFAQAEWQARARIATSGEGHLTGGLARYNLYAAADGRLIAIAALEPKFWATVCATIGLEPEHHDDLARPEAARSRVAALIAQKTSTEWAARFTGQEACVSVVATFDEAARDPHVAARGLFARSVSAGGASMPALPVPIDPALRDASTADAVPQLRSPR
jgi:alpha-methylacyl-CoA racemase